MNIKSLDSLIKSLNEFEKEQNNYIHNGFNIFDVLGIQTKEVIICRFLGEFLNPLGSHNLGNNPLKLFASKVLKDKTFDATNASVTLEEVIDKNRRVDIVIKSNNKVYPIEVKIWDGDQDAQLSDYYHHYFDNQYKNQQEKIIYYLTPTGWEPSKKSKIDLNSNAICKLSFGTDIRNWIRDILEQKTDNENVKTSLKQFEEMIIDMCKNTEELNCILENLNIDNKDNADFENDTLKTVIKILKHKEDIIKNIQLKYLKNKLCFDKSRFDIEDCNDEDKKKDKNVLLTIVKKDNREKIAWICVEENLYFVCNSLKPQTKCDDWDISGVDNKYCWRYIKPVDYKKKKFKLDDCTNLVSKSIEIDECLNDIDFPQK